MITPLDILPKSIAPAVLAYLAVCFGLGDVFAGRLAERHHIPACVEGRLDAAARASHGRDLERQIARDLLEGVLKSMPELRELPGVRAIEGLSQRRSAQDHRGTDIIRCACLAAAAQDKSRFDHMFWVASLRLYEPAGVARFGGVMTRLDQRGTCGKGGSS
ncbi:MAG: hypothetical protein AAFQ17_02725 [Pseudomonadota bacterium]